MLPPSPSCGAASGGTTTTGHVASVASFRETLPKTAERSDPRPREPTTSSSAPSSSTPPAGARPGCPRRRARRRPRRRGSRSAPRPPRRPVGDVQQHQARAEPVGEPAGGAGHRPRGIGRVDSTDDRAGHRDPPGSLVRSSRRSRESYAARFSVEATGRIREDRQPPPDRSSPCDAGHIALRLFRSGGRARPHAAAEGRSRPPRGAPVRVRARLSRAHAAGAAGDLRRRRRAAARRRRRATSSRSTSRTPRRS